MGTEELTTLNSIMSAGKKEFLQNGFQAASLRNIVKKAGVTTGAFYGYYDTKKALFDTIVRPAAESFIGQFVCTQNSFEAMEIVNQMESLGDIDKNMSWIVDCLYEYKDEFLLIVYKSKGTQYEEFFHQIMEIEMNATHRFVDRIKSLGYKPKEIDEQLEHILLSGFFSALFELIAHDTPKEKAYGYVEKLNDFYTAGWKKIMGL